MSLASRRPLAFNATPAGRHASWDLSYILRRTVRQTGQAALPTIRPARCDDRVWTRHRRHAHSIHSPFPFGPRVMRTEPFMNSHVVVNPFWSTASFGDTVDTSPMELSALGEHLDLCKGSRGRMFRLQCVAETLNGFVAARLVTTLVVVALLIGAASLVL